MLFRPRYRNHNPHSPEAAHWYNLQIHDFGPWRVVDRRVIDKAGLVVTGRFDCPTDEKKALSLHVDTVSRSSPGSVLRWWMAGMLRNSVQEWETVLVRALEVEAGNSADNLDSEERYIHQWWPRTDFVCSGKAGLRLGRNH